MKVNIILSIVFLCSINSSAHSSCINKDYLKDHLNHFCKINYMYPKDGKEFVCMMEVEAFLELYYKKASTEEILNYLKNIAQSSGPKYAYIKLRCGKPFFIPKENQ